MDISLLLSAAKSAPDFFDDTANQLLPSPVSIQMVSPNDSLHRQIEAAERKASLPQPSQSSLIPKIPQRTSHLVSAPNVSTTFPSVVPNRAKQERVTYSLENSECKSELLRGAITKPPSVSSPVSKAKLYVCQWEGCNAKFGQKGSLTRHMKSRHEKLRPHVCDLCNKCFSEKWTLNVHRRNVHEKRKPHKCNLCEKTFGERWNLRKHINVVHENIKPYSCSICSRAFGYKGDMRKHVMELHVQGGRPFQCSVPSCGVKFARLRYLRRHQNLTHRNPDDKRPEGDQDYEGTDSDEIAHSSMSSKIEGSQYLHERQRSEGDGLRSSSGRTPDYTALHTLSMYASTVRQA